jgi:hypothetical protein
MVTFSLISMCARGTRGGLSDKPPRVRARARRNRQWGARQPFRIGLHARVSGMEKDCFSWADSKPYPPLPAVARCGIPRGTFVMILRACEPGGFSKGLCACARAVPGTFPKTLRPGVS